MSSKYFERVCMALTRELGSIDEELSINTGDVTREQEEKEYIQLS